MTSFADPQRIRAAPIRVVLYIERELYDKGENAARILGVGTVEKLMVKLLENVVTDLESQGYDLMSNWLKKVVGDRS